MRNRRLTRRFMAAFMFCLIFGNSPEAVAIEAERLKEFSIQEDNKGGTK